MTTLGGDLIRILARGGVDTLMGAGGQLFNNYLQTKAKEKLLGLEANLQAAAVEENPDIQQQILQQIRGPLNLAAVKASGMAPIGERATLGNLGMRKGLTYPGSTYAPASVERIVAPVPAMEALKSRTLMGLGPDERKTALFPKDASLQAALLKAQGDWALREKEGEANRLSRESMAADRLSMQEMVARMHDSTRQQALAQTQQMREFMMQNAKDKIGLLKDINEQKQMQGELGKLTTLEGKIVAAKKPDEKRMFMSQANGLIKNSKALAGYPMWEEDAPIPGTGYTLPIIGEVGAAKQRVPVGQKPSAAPKAGPPAAYLTNYKAALTANANNPEALAEIQRRAKSRYPNHTW